MSTIKVNNIDPPNVGEGVSIDGLQMPTAGAFSNRNLIINGAMQVAQRGTSITSTGYFIDRFSLETSSGDTVASQLDTTAGDTPYTLGFRKHARIANTSGTTASNGFRDLRYRIEAQDIANSGWNYTSSSSYLTLSFWVRSSVAQTYSVYMRSMNGTKQRYAYTFALSANTWTKVTQSFPGDSNITIDNNNSAGFEININPYWGPSYTANSVPNNVWQPYVSGERVQDMTNTWATTVGATFDVTGVQLEVGSKATPFEHESYGQTVEKCKRYYRRLSSIGGGYSTIMVGHATGPQNGSAHMPFFPEMRTGPDFDCSATSDFDVEPRDKALTSKPTINDTSKDQIQLNFACDGNLSIGESAWLTVDINNGFVEFDAEL
jgi:hypothetical protein